MEEALVFEWDEAKANANYRKHRVTFQLAARAFDDDHGLNLVDDRWTTAKSAGYVSPWSRAACFP